MRDKSSKGWDNPERRRAYQRGERFRLVQNRRRRLEATARDMETIERLINGTTH